MWQSVQHEAVTLCLRERVGSGGTDVERDVGNGRQRDLAPPHFGDATLAGELVDRAQPTSGLVGDPQQARDFGRRTGKGLLQ